MTHLSVAHSIQANPWWQLLLPLGSSVSSIRVWPRRPQMWVEPIVSVTIKALDTTPDGSFILQVSIDEYKKLPLRVWLGVIL